MPLPRWIEPQLCKLATKAPSGAQWVHEIKLDGYRMAARIEGGMVKLLTRSGVEWTAKYPATAAAIARLKVRTAYLDGELCGVRPDGVTSFELMQHDAGREATSCQLASAGATLSPPRAARRGRVVLGLR